MRRARIKASHGVTPGLAAVLVGADPASQVYVRSKVKQTREAGMASFEHVLPAETTQAELLSVVDRLNRDPTVHGILVQLPLPQGLDSQAIIAAIDPAKDVDGLNPVNAGRLASGLPALTPCTPLGCIILSKTIHTSLEGLNAVVIGRSNLVGRPLIQLLLNENATVTIAHSRTRDLPAICRGADLLLAAVGKPEIVKRDWIKPGATVIDVGINRIPSGNGKTRLVGDVAFDEAREVARCDHPGAGRRRADDGGVPARQHAARGVCDPHAGSGGGVGRKLSWSRRRRPCRATSPRTFPTTGRPYARRARDRIRPPARCPTAPRSPCS